MQFTVGANFLGLPAITVPVSAGMCVVFPILSKLMVGTYSYGENCEYR